MPSAALKEGATSAPRWHMAARERTAYRRGKGRLDAGPKLARFGYMRFVAQAKSPGALSTVIFLAGLATSARPARSAALHTAVP